ncbi:hypothetical protein J1N35_011190 [Gossypium stocksii]|uniref:Uncharacterized protein n=1 Tax=Gossypium stocksii TaxID=47602 RepID=A0A9D3W2B8_9ROSI|nr:hypothetical protein J1N35_011190 [Gossypium stocksii]
MEVQKTSKGLDFHLVGLQTKITNQAERLKRGIVNDEYYTFEEMILVAIVAELIEEYTVLLCRLVEHLFHEAPFPRRIRFLILSSLPVAFSTPPLLPAPA